MIVYSVYDYKTGKILQKGMHWFIYSVYTVLTLCFVGVGLVLRLELEVLVSRAEEHLPIEKKKKR